MRIRDWAFQRIFSRTFVYNILFEDAEVDERLLDLSTDATVLSITGAGCGVAGMLSRHPRRIDAVDINRHHLALTAVKCAAATDSESYTDFYDLLGRGWSPDPRGRLSALCRTLPSWIGAYWSAHAARFERSLYLRGLTASMLAHVRRRAMIGLEWARALTAMTPEQRLAALHEAIAPLDRKWFRSVLDTPVSLMALGINYTQRDRLVVAEGAPTLPDLFVSHLTRVMHTDLATNWFFWWAAAGQFDHDNPEAVPPYLRRDRFERSRAAPTAVRYRHGNVFDVLAEARRDTWSHFTMCDAVDWMTPDAQRHLFREIRRTGRPGALVLLRSVEADDPVASSRASGWLVKLPISEDATLADRSRQYRQVNLYRLSA